MVWGCKGVTLCSRARRLQEHPTDGQKAWLGFVKTTMPGQEGSDSVMPQHPHMSRAPQAHSTAQATLQPVEIEAC